MPQVFRPDPAMPVSSYKSYEILAPESTHWRVASCEELDDCPPHRLGWETHVDESEPIGQRRAYYIRRMSGRHFTERVEAGITIFTFAAGQDCFTEHRVRLDREEIFAVRGGDHRGTTEPRKIHDTADDWVDDFAEHQDKLATGQG